jgi:hypothetical protein
LYFSLSGSNHQKHNDPLGVIIPKGPSGSHTTTYPAGIPAPSRSVAGEPCSTGQDATSHRRAKSRSKHSVSHQRSAFSLGIRQKRNRTPFPKGPAVGLQPPAMGSMKEGAGHHLRMTVQRRRAFSRPRRDMSGSPRLPGSAVGILEAATWAAAVFPAPAAPCRPPHGVRRPRAWSSSAAAGPWPATRPPGRAPHNPANAASRRGPARR